MVNGVVSKRTRSQGFSLIEVVVALAILAIAFCGMIAVITYTSRQNASTRQRMFAMRAAERKIEQMLSCTDFNDRFLQFSAFTEGRGWEAVRELDELGIPRSVLEAPTYTADDVTLPSGYAYKNPSNPGADAEAIAARDGQAVLFVRFPLNQLGTGFDETTSGRFIDPYRDFRLPPHPNMDFNRLNGTNDTAVQIANCEILPVVVEVFWKGLSTPKGHLRYHYTFLRKI